MDKSIFRKVSLERLSSPEKIDQLLYITNPYAWVSLFGILLILAFVIIWSFFGEIPVEIEGNGMLMKAGGVMNIKNISNCIIEEINISPGDYVNKGNVIAKIKRIEEPGAPTSNFVSPYSGTIIEVMVNRGSFILQGEVVASVEPANQTANPKDIRAIIYIPISEGKNIEVGMSAYISPSTVKKEEYGYLLGKVSSVSSYPATFQGMMKIFGNESIVKSLSSSGPVIALEVELFTLASAPSGYAWSSKKGPDTKILGGTICSGYVIVEKKRPISFVIPILK
ncbi:MAG TPA: NHLP bacteriocin system secretion protein [Spirochaetota bacterium]|nr:NHLP bacteriocin system secretion protein [Spirochaetota bacterium]HOS32926.1 NHLP bacteriocin system secretion protein [Spirochaetota bacterium]HOS55514.1 NHLP bacteriocin system secretion protein [Spirochaetota bacterium]HPK61570.1 NHLP bacteriocin system secretion protein [Spirochaetota bacterium]HQF78113.1 NHLP bacteriocin system secretion protein [Spirochaetota bacterium]